jgi:hypothetical protein
VKSFGLLLAICICSHAQSIRVGTWSGFGSPMAGVRFESHTEPEISGLSFIGSSNGRTIYRGADGYSATHRYFRDDSDLTYVGYDVLVEQGSQPDEFKITFLELGIGPLDFAMTPSGAVNPTAWKKLTPPPLPPPRIVHVSDKLEVPVWVDPKTGQKLIDVIQVQATLSSLSPQMFPPAIVQRMPAMPGRTAPTVPTVEGTAREFRAEDAEMHLVQPRVTVNGDAETSLLRAGNAATGTLVWFYLPKRGRYILSLVPRPDLGFSKAGELRGGAVKFKLDGDEFLVETYQPIAPGSAPYIVYAMHDKEWEPTARNQTERLLFGSVSPAELASLMKK